MLYIILIFIVITLVTIFRWHQTQEEKTAVNNQMELIKKMLALIWLAFLAGIMNNMFSEGASLSTIFTSSFWPLTILILLVALKSGQMICRSFPSSKKSTR